MTPELAFVNWLAGVLDARALQTPANVRTELATLDLIERELRRVRHAASGEPVPAVLRVYGREGAD